MRLTVKEHIKAGTHPSCTTKQQFAAWATVQRHANVRYFCEDCTASYEASMRLAGKCDKHASR